MNNTLVFTRELDIQELLELNTIRTINNNYNSIRESEINMYIYSNNKHQKMLMKNKLKKLSQNT